MSNIKLHNWILFASTGYMLLLRHVSLHMISGLVGGRLKDVVQ
jgi:hypothetical protein